MEEEHRVKEHLGGGPSLPWTLLVYAFDLAGLPLLTLPVSPSPGQSPAEH